MVRYSLNINGKLFKVEADEYTSLWVLRDELVLWAFNPGLHPDGTPREKPLVSEEEYIATVKKCFEMGAVIPGD